MGNVEKLIVYGNIKLISPYEIKQLNELRIVKKMNDHAVVYFTGIIPEEKKDSYIEKAMVQDKIEVVQTDGSGIVRTLFKGLVSNIGIRCVRGIYYIEAEGLSHTCALDVKRKHRSFQNKNMSYKDMISKVTAEYSGADFQDTASNGSKLGEFTVQYNETDWIFLKRMASRFGAVLAPQADSDKPKFWFGLPRGKEKSISEGFHYTVKKDISRYMDLSANSADSIEEHEFTYFEAESSNYLDLGDKVKLKEKNLMVTQSTAVMKNGALKYEYIFAPENGMKQNRRVNNLITGASIEGKVIDTQKDNVKVHLEIDKEQNKGEACWFRYATNYTAEGNSGWYCMPQLGDSVKLYIPTGIEESAVVMSSVRKGGQNHPKTAKPSIKYLQTNYGKHMKLGEKDLEFTAKENAMFITLDEDKGVDIQSDKEIMLYSEKNLEIDAKSIQIVAKNESIGVTCNETSSIVMDGETHVKGTSVSAEGSLKAPMSLGDVLNMVKDTVMMPVEAAIGVASMASMLGNAAVNGKLGETSLAIATSVPVVAGAIKVTGMDKEVQTNTVMESGKGKTGLRGVRT